MIYLDNAATTALSPSVMAAMTKQMTEDFGNPSSIHAFGRKANQNLRNFRQTIAQSLKTDSRQIIFTSGGTESNKMAIQGYTLANQDKGKHLITSSLEHHSVLHLMAYLEERFGFEVTYLEPEDGQITPSILKKALRPDTILVSLMMANNETGDLYPIKELAEVLVDHQAVFHVDAVQAMGKVAVYPEELGVDFLSASGHKFHGPKGVGFLYAKPHHMDALLHGGEQEEKRRASTENMVGLAGLAQAVADSQENLTANLDKVQNLRDSFLEEIKSLDYYVNGTEQNLPYVINLGFPSQDNGMLLTRLDLAGIAVSTGSACTAGTVEPSHVLSSIYGPNSNRLKESIRVSFSEDNSLEDIKLLAKTLKEIVGK